jgi:hypothetical protein
LQWDAGTRQFTNLPEANGWLNFEPRGGWDLSI